MKSLTINILLFLSLGLYAQTGINTETVNANAEFQVVSPANDKGVLIPRMTLAQMALISTPAEGLVVYTTDDNTFYYFNGITWQRIGEQCTILIDNDQDTKIEVDDGADIDEVHITIASTMAIQISKTGLNQLLGNLAITSGTLVFDGEYSLPTSDGTAGDVLVTDGAGNVSWQDPKTLPGLVAGVQTYSLAVGREYQQLGSKIYYTTFLPWTNMTVNKLSFCLNASANEIIEVGIYYADNRLQEGSANISSAGEQFVEVTLGAPVKLVAGQLYTVAIVGRKLDWTGASSYVLENPYFRTTNLHFADETPSTLELTSTIGTKVYGHKPVWFCLY